ncbi:MAG: hypothetical protein LCH78_18065 [Proteobacteria bacterium]|nr:hypothetical protein [Pseudomonadota bacterium]
MAAGRKTGGRQKGTPNKATADIKALAMEHAAKAMSELARLATEAESEAARVAAIKELFDRGFGKARQGVDIDASVTGELTANLHTVEYTIVDPATGPGR